ncbi:uncharacterized protein LOC124278131 [Haliotis rubra]|uniref:uncharacterized protein LOC124278131 n=1 Tax=Haliotis rubra TaxID=36100 RepID=UPI001EE58933|nr:uncharacterized protein LOC124278131 [Haliotis rubra]
MRQNPLVNLKTTLLLDSGNMAAKYWLGIAICLSVVSEYSCQRTCSLTAGRLPISVGYCTDEDGNRIAANLQSRLPSRSTCRVTCLEDAELRFLICDDGTWHMTPNLCNGMEDVQLVPRRRQKRWLWIPILIIGWWGSRPGPPPDRSPPVVTCPMDIHKFSDPIQTSTKVYWNDDDASAYDNKDRHVAACQSNTDRTRVVTSSLRLQAVTLHVLRLGSGPDCGYRRCVFHRRGNIRPAPIECAVWEWCDCLRLARNDGFVASYVAFGDRGDV